ncbi:MAG: bacillithiol system redox-active protein YtxJ [Bacteroidetes bacterium]|nr:bacillithiol system redox-active protein YtxJ [Bacteroidota bacterium]
MRPVVNWELFEAEVRAGGILMLFKHSPRCGISAMAEEEIQLAEKTQGFPEVLLVDVLDSRPLSQKIAAETGIRHESPQVILFKNGEPVWHCSHHAITAANLQKRVSEFSSQDSAS